MLKLRIERVQHKEYLTKRWFAYLIFSPSLICMCLQRRPAKQHSLQILIIITYTHDIYTMLGDAAPAPLQHACTTWYLCVSGDVGACANADTAIRNSAVDDSIGAS